MNTVERAVQPEYNPHAGRNKRYKVGILIVLLAMLALTAWAWWIPNGVFDPWVEAVKKTLGR